MCFVNGVYKNPETGYPFVLRPATMNDAKMILEWRNHPSTRTMSKCDKKINTYDHMNWWEQSLLNPMRNIQIAVFKDEPIGMIRSDYLEGTAHDYKDGVYLLSWLIAPKHRAKGFGTMMLRAFIDSFHGSWTLKAEIKPENAASKKMAERLGFVFRYHNEMEDVDVYTTVSRHD